ncbi:hypothetical protein CBR_g28667 [Chara braunii]|uniref:DUF659 domain-containing protein n=1 Tax=Chara braunii TaxID=69332 RepID=A0A388L9P9_CHABU|nr:hypothetical protein CBR_g28667 [Chara braunii]|eukprot:GBG78952.1 hypothetical protein CBR_g28667 [Chara braunii]
MSAGQGGRAREPFRAVKGDEREELLLTHDIWQWVDRGHKNVGRATGSWRMQFWLCSKELDGAVNRAVNHFIQPSNGARCKHVNGEILYVIYKPQGKSKIPQKLLSRLDAHMRELGYPSSTPTGMGQEDEVGEDGCEEDPFGDVPSAEGNRLEPTPGGDGAAADLPPRPPSSNASWQQTLMTSYLVDVLQREMNHAIAQFFYENAIVFNAARSDAYKKVEKVMGDAARAKKVLTLPSYDILRTDELQGSYKKTDTDMDEIRSTWPKTRYTLMTDGTTTTSNRPVINFLAGGDKGAMMVKSMDMEGKDKSAPALAKMWEGVIRELGVKNINAICTDSAHVNISARNILAKHPDPEIRQIPWVPCACHICNLLMGDIASVSRKGKQRRVEAAAQGDKSSGKALELITPGETRFGTHYLMLKRLQLMETVLMDTMCSSEWDAAAWEKSKVERARACRELVRSVEWWKTVDEVVKLLELVYKFMWTMDSDGRMGPHIWSLAVTLENRMKSAPMDDDIRKVVMQKVKQRMEMMALPVHAATHMLHPANRSADLFDNLEAPVIHNTLAHIATIYPVGTQACKKCWDSLLSFHQRDPEWTGENSEEYLSSKRISMAQWWMTYGKKHVKLQGIAIKVLNMWTTASPCERNWSTFDLVHTKRRNKLSPDTLEKLVFMHWNTKLLRMSRLKRGYVNTERLSWETLEDVAPHDGFMQDGEYDPEDVARRAANRSRGGSHLSKATMLDIQPILYEVEDDGAWLAAQTYTPPPLRPDRARVVEDVLADSNDEEEEDEIADLPLQCSRARITASRREQGDDSLVGGVTATPTTRVDESAVGGAGSCVTTSIGHHASAAVAVGGRSTLQRSTSDLLVARVQLLIVFMGALNLAIGGSSTVDGGVAVGVTVSDTGAGCPGDAADLPAGKVSADLDVDMSDAGGECRRDSTTIPPAADVFASLINFISPEDYTISPLTSPLQTDSEDNNPPRERLSSVVPPVPRFDEETTPSSTAVHRGMSPSDVQQPAVQDCARISWKRMSPPEINQEVVRTVKSMAGRKKGSKNKEVSKKMDVSKKKDKSKKREQEKEKDASKKKDKSKNKDVGEGPSDSVRRPVGRPRRARTEPDPDPLEMKRAIVRAAKVSKALKLKKKLQVASHSPTKRGRKRRRVVDDDFASYSSTTPASSTSSSDESCTSFSGSDSSSK